MSKINMQRKGCKDVFNASLVYGASYSGLFDIPRIRPTYSIPNRLISFSKAISCRDYDQWVHFYEDDYKFERIWRNPQRYIEILKKYNGVILPDFSLYRDMPLVMQLWNIYRSRAFGYGLQSHGVKVIPNIRFGDERTFDYCCEGISKHCIIAVGSHSNIKNNEDREYFLKGLDYILKRLDPKAVVVYGATPEEYFNSYEEQGVKFIKFSSECADMHEGVV